MRRLAPTLFLLLAAATGVAAAQVCHDWDGDAVTAGWSCPTDEDCADRAWRRNPGALEVCDGLDNDCDGVMDSGCDRYCDTSILFPGVTVLEVEDLPEASEGCVGFDEDGILAVTGRYQQPPEPVRDRLLYARPYDRQGNPMGPSFAIGDPEYEEPYEDYCRLALTGDRALVSYHDMREEGGWYTEWLKARVLDRMGRPIGPLIDLSATSPIGSDPWDNHASLWDGDRFVVFWSPADDRRYLLMSIIYADGTLPDPATIVVTNDANGQGNETQRLQAVWTGDHYVVIFNVSAELSDPDTLHTARVSREGVLLGRGTIPADPSGWIAAALGNDRIGVLFARSAAVVEPYDSRWFVAFVDLDGNYLPDPGVLMIHQDVKIPHSGYVHIAWTGEMFGAAFQPWFNPQPNVENYEWRFSRILPDGTLLDPGGNRLLSDDTSLGDLWGLHWEGMDFALYARLGPDSFVRQKIVCSCDDEDADSFDACGLGDCDDTDPDVNPGEVESCRGLKDDDCDGLVDCDDADCPGGAGPADVTGVAWNGSALEWVPVSGAERYDVARGLLSDLQRRGDTLQSECAGVELDAASWADDGRLPPTGDGLWYLVRPEGAPCETGDWGEGLEPREVNACR